MISTDVNQIIYQGDGRATVFSYPFKIFSKSDVKLVRVDRAGHEAPVITDYYIDVTTSKVYYPGYAPGSVENDDEQPLPVQEGEKLIIYREVPITQEVDLPEMYPFNLIETMADKGTVIDQQIKGDVDRALKISRAGYIEGADFTIPYPADDKNHGLRLTKNGFTLVSDPSEVYDDVVQLTQAAQESATVAISGAARAETASAAAEGASAMTQELFNSLFTAERYGIKVGPEYAASNSARIRAVVNRTGGSTIYFGEGDYYFSEPIPMSRKGHFEGASMRKTVLHFPADSSGFKGDINGSYVWGQYIGNMTIEAGVPIDMSDTTVLEYFNCKFQNLVLIGNEVCVKGTDNGKNPSGGTLAFHLEWDTIVLESNNLGFKNLCTGNTNYFENIIDNGSNIKTLFYNTTGTFVNVNCSYAAALDYVWYFSADLANTIGYGAHMNCYHSNLEDINKAFVYCEDGAYSLSIRFVDVNMDTNTAVKNSTFPAIQVPFVNRIDLVNCTKRYFEETRVAGVPFIKVTRHSPSASFLLNVPDGFTVMNQSSQELTATGVTKIINAPYYNYRQAAYMPALAADYVYAPKINRVDTITITATNQNIPIGEVFEIQAASTVSRMVTIMPAGDNIGRKWAVPGAVVTFINKTASTFNFSSYNASTNYGFQAAHAVPAGESISFILQTNGTLYQWVKLGGYSN